MKVLAIDPGTYKSGVVEINHGKVIPIGDLPNEEVLRLVGCTDGYDAVVCEWIESYGMAVGKEVFETVFFIGRMCQASSAHFHRTTRKEVKINFCNTHKATDSNIRTATIDRYGGASAVGKKSSPGPLFGVTGHMWQALAVGLTYIDQQKEESGGHDSH